MKRRPLLLVAGVAVALAALVGLEARSSLYFSTHMLQHMLFVLVAAPLIAVSGLTRRPGPLRSLLVVGVLHAGALWAWHFPVLYDAAMRSDLLHALEHLSFVVTAVLFWDAVFEGSMDRFKRTGLVFATMLQSGALGALLVFATTPLYGSHVFDGIGAPDPLPDQQLAGAIMWVPPGVVYLAVMIGLLARALSAFDAAEQP